MCGARCDQTVLHRCVLRVGVLSTPTDYQLCLVFSPPSITCRCRRILSPWCSFVLVPSRPLSHQETQVIRAESLKNLAPFFVSCFFQDSPEIHINIFWCRQSFQFFNPHLHTETSFQILFRSCDDCSFSRIPSSAFLFVTSLLPLRGGFCIGVGVSSFFSLSEALSLVRLPYLFLRTCTTMCSLFWRAQKTAVPHLPDQSSTKKTSQNSVTTEEGETSTSVTSGTICTCTRVSGSKSDKSSGFSKRFYQERTTILQVSTLTEDFKKPPPKQNPHIFLFTVSSSSSSLYPFFSSSLFLVFYLFSNPFSFTW